VLWVSHLRRQDIHDMIVAWGGSRVLFASKNVIVLRIKRKVFARAHCLSRSMRFKHRDRRACGSAKEAHLKVQTEASDRSLYRHHDASHPRKRGLVEVPSLLLFGRRCKIRWLCGGFNRGGLRKVLIQDRVPSSFGTAVILCTLRSFKYSSLRASAT